MGEIEAPYRPEQLYCITEFEVGEIWSIKDELISIPYADRSTAPREFHEWRTVVIAHNNILNSDPTWPIVMVAPLSHRTDLMRDYDLEVLPGRDGVREHSIIRLSLVQPVLKVDLDRKFGRLSEEKLLEMLAIEREMLLGPGG